jgi:thiamine biosynthesis lipoprotein
MGTTVSITVYGDEPDAARLAVSEARNEIQRIGSEWYPWARDGELVRINSALAAGQPGSASTELALLLKRAQGYCQLSDGAFDPALGSLVRLWGFDSADRDARALPSEKQIAAWVKNHPTLADIQINNTAITSARRDVVLDLGAIGKGYAVDRAIELLKQRGVRDSMVNAAGNLRVIGSNNEHPWRIAIRDPRAVRMLGWLELNDESVATSGDYERFALVAGKRIHHLLDPRTGRPADHTIAITVIASDATLADAAATALFIAGPAQWQQVAHALGVDQVLRVDASGQVQVTAKLHARLKLPSRESRQNEWTVVN